MRVLGIIPARAGSKRVPGKNLRPLNGKELVARSIEAALGAPSLSKVVVSSDSEEVLAVARRYPEVVALRRPDAFSTDTSPAIEYVRHALETLEGQGDGRYDAVAIVQPSSPFTLASDIEETVATLKKSPEASSAVTVMEVEHALHPVKFKRLEGDQLLPLLDDERGRMAAHELPKVYVRNCSVYVSRRATIEQGELIGTDSRAVVMPRERSLDINDELDFDFARFLAGRGGGA